MKRGYADGRYGQVHFWQHGAVAPADTSATAPAPLPDLYCLHATAYSGQTMLPLLERLGAGRRVLALDTPGYGGSDAPPQEIDFGAYADAIAEAISATRHGDGPVDLFGYHTGAMLAIELAARHPQLVRRLVLIGIPYFAEADLAAWRDKLVHVTSLTESFEQFRARWDYFITKRTPGLSLARAFDCFVDELRSYPRDWWAHKALMDYRAAPRLPLVGASTLVLNPSGALAQFSRNCAAALPRATLTELPHVGGAPFDLAPDVLADAMRSFFAAP